MREVQKKAGIALTCGALTVPLAGLAAAPAGTADNAHDTSNDEVSVFIESARSVNPSEGTVTLPLFRGTYRGQTVRYIVTESSNKDDTERRGVNHAPKTANALGTRAVQNVQRVDGTVRFSGTVDFSPELVVVPEPDGFPPARFQPGAVETPGTAR